MILSAKKYVAALLVFVCVCMIFSPLTAYAAEDSSQHETVKVGFFAMDGYHVMDEEGNRSGYGYDFLRLMARYWDVDYEYVGYDKSFLHLCCRIKIKWIICKSFIACKIRKLFIS